MGFGRNPLHLLAGEGIADGGDPAAGAQAFEGAIIEARPIADAEALPVEGGQRNEEKFGVHLRRLRAGLGNGIGGGQRQRVAGLPAAEQQRGIPRHHHRQRHRGTRRPQEIGEGARVDLVAEGGEQAHRLARRTIQRGDGAFGQYGLVLPEQDAAIAITSGLRDMQEILDLVWKHLLPAMHDEALPDDPAAQEALATKLKRLMLPVPAGEPSSSKAASLAGKTFTLAENDFGARTVAVDAADDTVTLTLVAEGTNRDTLSVTAGFGSWRAGRSAGRGHGDEPVAASAAWTDPDTLEVRVCFTESETCPSFRIRVGDGERITLEVDPNVAWGNATATTIAGVAQG